MSKYLALVKIFFNSAIIKRADFFGNMIITLIQISAIILLWTAIFDNQRTLNGYTLSDTISYYILVLFISYASTITTADYIANNIKSGTLSQWLLKPWNILYCELSRSIGDQIYRLIILFPIFLIIGLFLHFQTNTQLLLSLSISSTILGIVFVIIGFFINCLFEYSLAMLAFWLDEVWSIKHFKEVITDLLGGKRIPLSFFPAFLRTFNNYLPFQFFYFIPIEYFLGKRNYENLFLDLTLSSLWIIFLVIVANILYSFGLKRYGAFGN
ncbi:ABC-2 family transporter protein [Candidatus Dojkabacteria bacterium]|nr:ABC-2 family transporter protein [Candidatus Dojkabacteria bacterium]